jgi:dihydropteroate synthase
MQINPIYKNLIKEIKSFLNDRILFAKQKGISSEKLIIDPGLGFGKSVKHNYVILNKLSEFLDLNCPILIGSSRKSFIGKTLGSNSNRLFGTAATIAISILKGAKIFRVHDVKQIQEVIAISEAITSAKE